MFPKFRKVDKFAASIERPKAKNASALTPWPGALPLDPDGALPPGPRYRLATALAMGAVPPRFCGLEPPLDKS